MKLELSGILKFTELEIPPRVREEANLASLESGLKSLSEEKKHVTMIHQSLTKGLKSVDLGNIQLPGLSFDEATVTFVRDGERQTIKVIFGPKDQRTLDEWMEEFRKQHLPTIVLPPREYHISWANLTGLPGDSVK
jgi:hypothetical protein